MKHALSLAALTLLACNSARAPTPAASADVASAQPAAPARSPEAPEQTSPKTDAVPPKHLSVVLFGEEAHKADQSCGQIQHQMEELDRGTLRELGGPGGSSLLEALGSPQGSPFAGLDTSSTDLFHSSGDLAATNTTPTAPALAACGPGRDRWGDGPCCWLGQDDNGRVCTGLPHCPQGRLVVGKTCKCAPGKQNMSQSGVCCYPGQRASASRCEGAPTQCPSSWTRTQAHCAPPTPERMAYVPDGYFEMGPHSLASDSESRSLCERALLMGTTYSPSSEHTRGFFIDLHEVSVGEYKACVLAGACSLPRRGQAFTYSNPAYTPAHPVNGVSFEQATSYCAWRGKQLPTSAQWEKAARGEVGAHFPWGDVLPGCEQVASSVCGEGRLEVVESMGAGRSPYGLFHMAGNVSEWVEVPATADTPRQRGLQGGSWETREVMHLQPQSLSILERGYGEERAPEARGFRCAKRAR